MEMGGALLVEMGGALLVEMGGALLMEVSGTVKLWPMIRSCVNFSNSSGLKGITPAFRKPAHIVSGEHVRSHAFAKSSEKLNFVTTLPGDDW